MDPARFVVDPSLDIPLTKGWPYVRHNFIHDLAALAKHEMLLWDKWGWTDVPAEPSLGPLRHPLVGGQGQEVDVTVSQRHLSEQGPGLHVLALVVGTA